jgi:hypothetical protein
MSTVVEMSGLERAARDALETLLLRHPHLPKPPRIYWSEPEVIGPRLTLSFKSDADVDTWAKGLFREPTTKFMAWDNTYEPGTWAVIRYHEFFIPKWMGAGVGLRVTHAEDRNVRPERA